MGRVPCGPLTDLLSVVPNFLICAFVTSPSGHQRDHVRRHTKLRHLPDGLLFEVLVKHSAVALLFEQSHSRLGVDRIFESLWRSN